MSRQAVPPDPTGPATPARRPRSFRRTGLVLAFALCGLGVTARGVDVVIFKDGFKIQGRRFKEQERITDDKNQVTVTISAARGFDIIEDGPKWIIYSTHAKQKGDVIENLPGRGDPKEYKRDVFLRSRVPLPAYGEFKAGDFDKNWKRKIHVRTTGGNFHEIDQQIYSISPTRVIIPSTTHAWLLLYHTKELGPAAVRHLLAAHPELAEPDGKPDVGKRLEIAAFLRDAGFLAAAKEELEKLKEAAPGAWTKEQTERYEQLTAELPRLETRLLVDELEAAVPAGRYEAARALIDRFDGKHADGPETKRFADLKAQVEIVRPRFEKTRRLLRELLDELGDARSTLPHLAAAGGAVLPAVRKEPADARLAVLLEAGEQVYAELHPDTAGRVELFVNLAAQAEQQRKAGKPAGNKPEQLVALAVTGWLKGKAGAEPSPDAAARLWQARQMLLDYQNEDQVNKRRAIAGNFAKALTAQTLPLDELAQVITLLPPPKPEDLAAPDGKPIPSSNKVLPGLILKTTGPIPEAAAGVEYVLRLPPEYHHGRPYPVLLALSHPSVPAEQLVSLLAADADRHGYIVAAPVWTDETAKPYDYSGDQHYKATAVLRSLLRHYRADNDRVFLFGFGDGANFAMDVGASHPDLFAGLVAMGPTPKYFGMFMHYWRNLQKLPVYVVNGNLNGSGLENLRRIYEHWMPLGFPAIMSLYRGRGLEWYAAEVPTLFDWMGRKKRVSGTASLRLGQFKVEPWYVMRTGDNRFYWVGVDDIREKCLLAHNQGKSFQPAEVKADILQGNKIILQGRGVKKVIVWLDRDMIDWSKPVVLLHNGAVPKGYKPKVMQPDPDVLLEELYRTGDRTVLFLNKIELDVTP